jgi:hypothetical protein
MVVIHPKLKYPIGAVKPSISARQTLQRNPRTGNGIRGWGPVFEQRRKAGFLTGRLVDLSTGRFKAAWSQYYSSPVAMTKAAWDLVNRVVRGPRGCGNMAIAMESILAASVKGKRVDLRTSLFCVFLKGARPHSMTSFRIVEEQGNFGVTVRTIKLLSEK